MEEEGKGGACGEATKGTPTEGAGAPCKGKSTGRRKKVEEDRGRRSGMCGQAMRSAARKRRCKGDWAQDSRRILSYITVCNYDTTHLQENPQRLG